MRDATSVQLQSKLEHVITIINRPPPGRTAVSVVSVTDGKDQRAIALSTALVVMMDLEAAKDHLNPVKTLKRVNRVEMKPSWIIVSSNDMTVRLGSRFHCEIL